MCAVHPYRWSRIKTLVRQRVSQAALSAAHRVVAWPHPHPHRTLQVARHSQHSCQSSQHTRLQARSGAHSVLLGMCGTCSVTQSQARRQASTRPSQTQRVAGYAGRPNAMQIYTVGYCGLPLEAITLCCQSDSSEGTGCAQTGHFLQGLHRAGRDSRQQALDSLHARLCNIDGFARARISLCASGVFLPSFFSRVPCFDCRPRG